MSYLTTLLVFKAIFEPEALIKRSIFGVLQTGSALLRLVYKDKSATQLRRRVLQDFTFPIHILFQDSSSFGPSKAVS